MILVPTAQLNSCSTSKNIPSPRLSNRSMRKKIRQAKNLWSGFASVRTGLIGNWNIRDEEWRHLR